MQLTDFKVLTFDCYGTLIDWETGIFESLKPLVARTGKSFTRDQVLEAHGRGATVLVATHNQAVLTALGKRTLHLRAGS